MATRVSRAKAPKAGRPKPYRFTMEQYFRMGDTGIIREDERVELIEGEILEMPPIGDEHVDCTDALNMVLVPQVRGRAVVSIQNPVKLPPHSAPQPDILVLHPRGTSLVHGDHFAQGVILVIEVADSSLEYDLTTKARLYAEYGIPELWVWDVPNRRVYDFREPVSGRYQQQSNAGPGDTLEIAGLPGVQVLVSEVFGERP